MEQELLRLVKLARAGDREAFEAAKESGLEVLNEPEGVDEPETEPTEAE